MFSKFSNWISGTFIRWLITDRPHEGIPLCDFERIRYELRPCDVLLIEGRSRVSDIIRSITQSSWSHAALYVGRVHDIEDPKIRSLLATHWKGSPDTQLVIEGIMGQGTVISSISNYEHDHIRLCRPKGLSRRDAQHIIGFVARKLGNEYDVRHIVDLFRFMLPWTVMPRRMRSKLFEHHAGESTKTVCSSMIAEAFASVEFPILPLVKQHAEQGIELITRNPKLYTPRDFDYSPYFDIIKYPFVEFADYAMYRKLPWNREGLMSHDAVGITSLKPVAEPIAKETLDVAGTPKKKSALRRFQERFGRLSKVSEVSSGSSVSPGSDSDEKSRSFSDDDYDSNDDTSTPGYSINDPKNKSPNVKSDRSKFEDPEAQEDDPRNPKLSKSKTELELAAAAVPFEDQSYRPNISEENDPAKATGYKEPPKE